MRRRIPAVISGGSGGSIIAAYAAGANWPMLESESWCLPESQRQ